ncbi:MULTISPECIES: glutamine-hydrolyzing GMP synthase [Gordonibacter]|uniref:GMP synthase [glutamine-hydrolyzing] n=1 Tax=Gordonibacter faecis TaxID=3047475 RepID=A0ABT7DPX9_9ACTN|nr:MULTISPECIES: glutamine-hydrolyzing GMP synthase [unclassified Gordonibacter]MDJ1650566.1 glutamine-hydrolyzing GMP synthase [Gordonibacter sp. KGMB12511]HIW75734.1 glutamine-hydrolyzing GMP synthase [Candidatus Gordonibacter avicola]
MTTAPASQLVIVVDFGAQYGQLIARRVRDLQVYSEIVPCDVSADEVRAMAPSAIILSGGPASVYAEDAPSIDPEIFELGIPVLGFCYGQQIMAVTLGGTVGHTEAGEYGAATLRRCDSGASALYGETLTEQTVWMSHRDAVAEVPEGFVVTASTDVCPVASMECAERRLYATQFHPEVRHTACGDELLQNFLFGICGLEPTWKMDSIIDDAVEAIRAQVGDARVILGLSGGVDSSVVAALCAKAIGKQLTCVFVNHGLLRKNEPEEVEAVFTKQFDVDFVHVHAEDRYAALLADVTEPEEKRRIIGSQFWEEFFTVAQDLAEGGRPVKFLAQGTIYPDIIESGARKTGGKASTIKSHHNLIPFPEGVHFDLIEPLDHFFKDEVRALGTALGLPDHIVHRQPFPGPGLAIRIIGTVTRDKLHVLKEADAIVREELDAYNIGVNEAVGERGGELVRTTPGGPEVERPVWQYFAVLPDIKSVGVMGDERTYGYPIILRAVESSDAMTADWAKLPYEVLGRISGRIVSEVPGVNRVAYDITSKPPATIEWE